MSPAARAPARWWSPPSSPSSTTTTSGLTRASSPTPPVSPGVPRAKGSAGRLHLHHRVGQRPACLVGDGDVLPDGEPVLAQPVDRLVVGGVLVVVVEVPALAALHQLAVDGIFVRG